MSKWREQLLVIIGHIVKLENKLNKRLEISKPGTASSHSENDRTLFLGLSTFSTILGLGLSSFGRSGKLIVTRRNWEIRMKLGKSLIIKALSCVDAFESLSNEWKAF